MAVKIEKGGWIFIFLIGLVLFGYGLYRDGYLDMGKLSGGKSSARGEKLDTSRPLPPSATRRSSDKAEIRLRVNVLVRRSGGLVANGAAETAADSPFANHRRH